MHDPQLNQLAGGFMEAIARSSERMNAFAQQLSVAGDFNIVTTGVDFRAYESGWRFEKFVEAAPKNQAHQFAVWWLELGFDGNQWRIDTAIYVTNGDYRHEFAPMIASTIRECAEQLELATAQLKSSYAQGSEFRTILDDLRS